MLQNCASARLSRACSQEFLADAHVVSLAKLQREIRASAAVSLDLHVGPNSTASDLGPSTGGGFVWVLLTGSNNLHLICDVLIHFLAAPTMCYSVLWVAECLDCAVQQLAAMCSASAPAWWMMFHVCVLLSPVNTRFGVELVVWDQPVNRSRDCR